MDNAQIQTSVTSGTGISNAGGSQQYQQLQFVQVPAGNQQTLLSPGGGGSQNQRGVMLQLPQGQTLQLPASALQGLSGPVQIIQLGDQGSFIPFGQATEVPSATAQQTPVLYQTSNFTTLKEPATPSTAGIEEQPSSSRKTQEPQIIQIPAGMNLNQLLGGGAGGGQVMMLQMVGGQNTPVVPRPSQPEEEPLYVNAKQYHRILKRRQARAKLEQDGRIPKRRRRYLHESRHRHAMNRIRGEGGRFDAGSRKDLEKSLIAPGGRSPAPRSSVHSTAPTVRIISSKPSTASFSQTAAPPSLTKET